MIALSHALQTPSHSHVFQLVMASEEEDAMNCPILTCEEVTFMYIKHDNLYFVCTTVNNVGATFPAHRILSPKTNAPSA